MNYTSSLMTKLINIKTQFGQTNLNKKKKNQFENLTCRHFTINNVQWKGYTNLSIMMCDC